MPNAEKLKRRIFQQALSEVRIVHFLHYRDYLKHLYLNVKEKIRPYSYIKYTDDLGCGNNNTMRLIIIGKRPLTVKAGEKVADALELSGNERKYWIALILFNNAKRSGERERNLKRLITIKSRLLPTPLDESRLEYFSEWYNPVIRELATRSDFCMDPKWIQSKLIFPLRIEEVKKSLQLLTRLGLIYYNSKLDRYVSSDEPIDTGPDARGIAFIGYQQRMIELGKEAISRVDKDRRELVSATISLPETVISDLRRKIRTLVNEAATLEDTDGSRDATVLQLSVQLFPHTVD